MPPVQPTTSLTRTASPAPAGCLRGRSMQQAPPRAAAGGAAADAGDAAARSAWAFSTRLLHPRKVTNDPYAAISPPLYQTATFGQASATEGGAEYDYTRSGNPTRAQLEAQVADLEGGDAAFAFTSGMAALAAVLRLVPSGGHVVAGDDLYGGTSRLMERVAPGVGVSVSNVDTCDVAAVAAAMQPGRTALLMLESPTNPRMQVCDLRSLCGVAHAAGALVCVDNSVMAPTFQRPLALGADLSMTSATKFINGHSDVMAGTVSVRGADLAARVAFLQNAEGAGLAPFDCWLTLRGLKTMDLRMRAAADVAGALACFLDGHPLVESVLYPGLASHPGAALHASQASSAGSLLSFTTGNLALSRAVVEATSLFVVAVSFGSLASQISLPCYMSHASIPAAIRAARGLPDDLVRISAGVEDAADLLHDLEAAFATAASALGLPRPPPRVEAALARAAEAAGAGREAALERRIAALEGELEAAKARGGR